MSGKCCSCSKFFISSDKKVIAENGKMVHEGCLYVSSPNSERAVKVETPSSSQKASTYEPSSLAVRQDLSSMDCDSVANLIDILGLTRYRQGFIDAAFTGTMLIDLELREELAEVGIMMPSLIFKGFLQDLNEVHCSLIC